MSVIGILAWKSVLNNGATYPVADFADETSRAAVADDHWTPYNLATPDCPPNASRGVPTIDPEGLARVREVWAKAGYTGE